MSKPIYHFARGFEGRVWCGATGVRSYTTVWAYVRCTACMLEALKDIDLGSMHRRQRISTPQALGLAPPRRRI